MPFKDLAKRRAYKAAWAERHRDEMSAYYKERYEKNAEAIKAKVTAWYYANLGRARETRSQFYYRKSRAFYVELKSKPCLDCGVSYPWYVMEFDHVRGEKVARVGRLIGGRERLLTEIAKCDLVCSNCHAVRTYFRQLEKANTKAVA